jgi:hypothetical protein
LVSASSSSSIKAINRRNRINGGIYTLVAFLERVGFIHAAVRTEQGIGVPSAGRCPGAFLADIAEEMRVKQGFQGRFDGYQGRRQGGGIPLLEDPHGGGIVAAMLHVYGGSP